MMIIDLGRMSRYSRSRTRPQRRRRAFPDVHRSTERAATGPVAHIPRWTAPLDWDRGTAMPVQWIKDVDAALSQAAEQRKPLLLDFSAAPM